ncbi:MAG: glycosyltransferase, partial [Promethearchaeota archaeon]
FSHSSQLAGAERRLINLTNELISDYGTLCTVIIPNKGPLKEKLHRVGCATVRISYHWWCVDNRKHLSNLPRNLNESYLTIKLSRIINDIQPEIIITNTLVIPWGAVFAYENGIPHLWMVNEFGRADHGFIFNFGLDQTVQFIEAQSDKILTCSKSVKNELFNSSDQVDVIYDSFTNLSKDISYIKPADDVFLNDEAFHLLLTGTISFGKGQLDAVRAAIELIKNRGEKIELVLIGYPNNKYQNELITLIKNKNLENDIRILPFRDDIYPVMKSADVILLCSKFEAFGRVIVEGMLLNRPVIGTNTGGIIESIQDGKTGLLYSPGNYLELAEKIQKLMGNPKLRNMIAANGRSFALGKFSKQNFSGRFYSEFLELKRARNELSKKSCDDMIYLYQAILDGCISDNEDPERMNIITDSLSKNEQVVHNLEAQLIEKEQEILYYTMSKSWRITRPLRKLKKVIKNKGLLNSKFNIQ